MRKIILAAVLGGLLTLGGVVLAAMAMNRNVIPITGLGPTHPVTDPMLKKAAGMAMKKAPDFALQDTNGNIQTLAEVSQGKPTLIYFILDGCPCSTDAEPLFQKLYTHLNPGKDVKVPFVGIIGSSPKVGKAWMKKFEISSLVLSSEDHKVMKAYDAPNSAYCALVDQNGNIQKLWPGYSRRILLEINTIASELLGEQPRKFDTAYAPLEDSSGCEFGE